MAYSKPPGYRYSGLTAGASRYKRYNNSLQQAIPYLPGFPNAFSATYNFVAAPANNSTLTIGGVLFTFTYSGSPGPGVIPLVAGGGTAAQAATATKTAVDLQLSALWTTVAGGTGITFTSKVRGLNPTITASSSPNSNMAVVTGAQSVFGTLLPGRMGKLGCFLQG